MIDHISSKPAIVFPIKELIQFFKEKNIITIIDAAHAMTQVDVNIKDLQPDFYFSNFHKWSFAAKTSAFLYFDEKKYGEVFRPVQISIHKGEGIKNNFLYFRL